MNYRIKVWISIVVSIVLFLTFYYELPENQRNFINILSISGFLISVLGITIAFFQILSVKAITTQTQTKVMESIRLNNNIMMLSDLARKAGMVDEIQGFLREDKIELCIVRMKDLKVILNALKNQEYNSSLFAKKEFKTVFEDFNIDLDNFQIHHLNNRNRLDKIKIMKNLEALSTLLLSLEIKLKTI